MFSWFLLGKIYTSQERFKLWTHFPPSSVHIAVVCVFDTHTLSDSSTHPETNFTDAHLFCNIAYLVSGSGFLEGANECVVLLSLELNVAKVWYLNICSVCISSICVTVFEQHCSVVVCKCVHSEQEDPEPEPGLGCLCHSYPASERDVKREFEFIARAFVGCVMCFSSFCAVFVFVCLWMLAPGMILCFDILSSSFG